jgi:hypothetical protein
MSVLRAGRSADPSDLALRHRALALLIRSVWLMGEAADRGVPVSSVEVQRKLDSSFPGGSGELGAYLKASGQTIADARLQVGAELAASKLRRLASVTPAISHAQIAAFYGANKQLYAVNERRIVRLIVSRSKSHLERLKREVQHGRKFTTRKVELAHETFMVMSAPPSKRYGFERSIFAAPIGIVTGPVRAGWDWGLFIVAKAEPATYTPLSRVEGKIRAQLLAERRRQALHAFLSDWNAKWTGRTSCRSGYVVAGCRQYRAATSAEQPLQAPLSGQSL